jgi:hypothetical protein
VIAYDALMNVGAALGNFVPLWNVVHRQALPLGTCFPVITGPWLCLATTPATIMLVGADRFLNVFFPMQWEFYYFLNFIKIKFIVI